MNPKGCNIQNMLHISLAWQKQWPAFLPHCCAACIVWKLCNPSIITHHHWNLHRCTGASGILVIIQNSSWRRQKLLLCSFKFCQPLHNTTALTAMTHFYLRLWKYIIGDVWAPGLQAPAFTSAHNEFLLTFVYKAIFDCVFLRISVH